MLQKLPCSAARAPGQNAKRQHTPDGHPGSKRQAPFFTTITTEKKFFSFYNTSCIYTTGRFKGPVFSKGGGTNCREITAVFPI